MPSLPDVSAWLLYDETAMDTRKALWFVADAQDVTALDNQNAVCLAYGFRALTQHFFHSFRRTVKSGL